MVRQTFVCVQVLTFVVAGCGDADGVLPGTGSTGIATTLTTATPGSTGDGTTSSATTVGDASTSGPGSATSDDPVTTVAPTTTTADPTTTTAGPACAGGGLGPGDHTLNVAHGGMQRTVYVHVPAGYDDQAPTPLVVNFHGLNSNAGQQILFSLMNPTSDAKGFIVAYPEGIGASWNAGFCCGEAMQQGIDDVGFARALVQAIEDQLCVDHRRIYATGMSNGGFMSNRLGCEAADLFAAIAPVSASMVTIPCAPSRPIPVMLFNGTADAIVLYDGGLYPSAPQTFADWAARDGCIGAAIPTKQVGGTTCKTHDICDADAEVTFCTHEGMGHCWPGNPICPLGQANTDLDANAEMWAFFSKFTLP